MVKKKELADKLMLKLSFEDNKELYSSKAFSELSYASHALGGGYKQHERLDWLQGVCMIDRLMIENNIWSTHPDFYLIIRNDDSSDEIIWQIQCYNQEGGCWLLFAIDMFGRVVFVNLEDKVITNPAMAVSLVDDMIRKLDSMKDDWLDEKLGK